MRNHSFHVADLGQSSKPSRIDPLGQTPSKMFAIVRGNRIQERCKLLLEETPHPLIFIDGSIEASGDDIPEAVKADWRESELGNADKPGSLDFSGH